MNDPQNVYVQRDGRIEQYDVADAFAGGFSGVVDEILEDRSKVKVIVVIFGRKTQLELSFTQVTKE